MSALAQASRRHPGLSLVLMEHRERDRSLVGGGRAAMAEAWVRLRRDSLDLSFKLNSGLYGDIELQNQPHQLAPRPQATLSLGWGF